MFQFLNNAYAEDTSLTAAQLPAGSLPAGAAIPAGTTAATTATTAVAAAQPPQPRAMSMLMPFGLMFVVIYFFMIRPQQKKMKEQQSMLGSIKNGDDVLTSGGIFGTVAGLNERVVTLEISDNVKIKVLKSQIAQVVKDQVKDLA